MQFILLILALAQAAPPSLARGDRFQIVVPQGWKVSRSGADVALEHSTGASLVVRRPVQTRNLDTYAFTSVERIMAPLGFAKFEDPRRFKDRNEEWVQYEIRGNRLSEHRRILYRAVRREAGVFEVVYESSETGFDVLLTEAQSIAASLQAMPPEPPPRGRGRR